MVGNRLRGAMSDMAETIRRVFQAPPSVAVPLLVPRPASGRIPALAASILAPGYRFEAQPRQEPALPAASVLAEPLAWTAAVQDEPGWETWAAGATVCQLPLFGVEKCQRLLVPALPRKAAVQRLPREPFAARACSGWAALGTPVVRGYRPQWLPPRSRQGLAQLLTLPVAVASEDLSKISKALWMRYTLQLVRATGANIRNLDVLGLYRIPAKGTLQVHHDSATGRLLVTLGPEAIGARRAPFILARQKDDNSVVCCFVEET